MTRDLIVALAAVVLAAPLANAKSVTTIEIEPGPRTMSPEEAAIVADPAAGSQHGVILVEEIQRNDAIGTRFEIAYHMRAKILSAEGRSLADIEIPRLRPDVDLNTWWGRTILQDGKVLELPEQGLKSQNVIKVGSYEVRTLKGALPGVVPGCVIDYGYVIRGDGLFGIERVQLQKSWPVRLLRYRWLPSRYLPAAYVTSHHEGKSIDVVHDKASVLVTARDLSPVPDEPYMPPLEEVRASVTFYYTDSNEKPEEYWNLRAKRFETRLKTFIGNGAAIREAIGTMGISPGAPLPEKLQAAYAWIEQNITNTSLLSAEQEEALDDSEDNDAYDAKTVLRARQAASHQIDFLFAGVARELGAEANLVRATDRTDHFWNRGLRSLDQFDYTLVAVRAPGEPDEAIVAVDAGSGLPYGQVPWRATGANALLCTRDGARTFVVPPGSAKLNLSDTKVMIEFGEDNETILAKWYRRASGAAGMDHRRWFRDLDPSERKKTLDDFCGGSTVEVLGAELPEIAGTSGPFQVACDLDLGESQISDDIGRYSFAFTGPWWPETPEFPSATRTNPVIFEYPGADVVSIDVKAPRGFRAAAASAPIDLRTPFGRYQLAIVKNEGGFHVDRALALLPLKVDPPDYAALRSFLQDVAKHDRTSLLFERGGDKGP